MKPEAVWSPSKSSPAGASSSIVRRIAVAGPAAGEAVRTVNLLPAAALAGSAAVAYLLWRRRSKRGRLQYA